MKNLISYVLIFWGIYLNTSVAFGQRFEFMTVDSNFEAVIVLAPGAPTSGTVSSDWIESFLVQSTSSSFPQTNPSCFRGKFPPFTIYNPISLEISANGEQIIAFTHESYQASDPSLPIDPPVQASGWIYGTDAIFGCAGEIDASLVSLFQETHVGTWEKIAPEDLLPVCEFQSEISPIPSQGDSISATIRLVNPASVPVAVELKSWLTLPDKLSNPSGETFALINVGSDGSLELPPGFDQVIGPITLFTVVQGLPGGFYRWGCRLLNPATGKELNMDFLQFLLNP